MFLFVCLFVCWCVGLFVVFPDLYLTCTLVYKHLNKYISTYIYISINMGKEQKTRQGQKELHVGLLEQELDEGDQ